MEEQQVFKGIKVVELGVSGVGPIMGKCLADFGAEVIKIESITHPDILRVMPPYKDGVPGVDRAAAFTWLNTSKRSFTVNLNQPKGRELVKRLATWADIVIDCFSPGVVGKWGLDYDALNKSKPDVIMISTSQQGQTGPRCNFAGWGFMLKGLAGFVDSTGWTDRPAVGPQPPYTDFVAPWFGMLAIVAALDYRRRTGRGQYIDHSQFESSLYFLSPAIMDYFANQRVQSRQGNRSPRAVPHGVYPCKGEDRWCAIAVFSDEEWETLCKAMGSPTWAGGSKFTTILARQENEAEIDKLIGEWTMNFMPEELMNLLQSVGIAAFLVENAEDILERDPQLKHRGFWSMVNHMEQGHHRHVGWPYLLSESPPELQPAPCLGQDNEYVCTKIIGLSDQEFVELYQDGILE